MLALAAVVVAVLGVLLVGLLWGYAWVRLGPSTITALEEEVDALGAEPPRAPEDATTLLVVLTEPRGDRTVPGEPALAAPVLLVQYGPVRDTPAVVVLPANLPVAVDGEGLVTLAQAQAGGGTDGVLRAVRDYSAVRIDHVVVATTELLPGLTDQLGPIERCGVVGCRELTGQDVRLTLAQGPVADRIDATLEVLRDLSRDLSATALLRTPLRTVRSVEVVARELTTDVSLRGHVLLDLAAVLSGRIAVDLATIEAETDPETGELVTLPERAELRFQQLRDGLPLTPDETEQEPETDEPADDGVPEFDAEPPDTAAVRVAVLNGAGVTGLAATVRDQLQAAGIAVVGTGNAATFDREVTIVSYDADDPAAAELAAEVAAVLGDVALDPVPRTLTFEAEPVAVVVTIGADLAPEE